MSHWTFAVNFAKLTLLMTDKHDSMVLPKAFADLGVRDSVLRGLAQANYIEPSEIQRLLIPRALAGVDILGQARTGTGKTAAFGIPILCRAERGVGGQALILTPTRELANQVEEEVRRLAGHTPLRTASLVGGQKIQVQTKALSHDPEILVGTPGRVIDLLDRRLLSLDNIRFIVLDEVDRMLDIGFRDDVKNILRRIKRRETAPRPADRFESESNLHQTIFVSATISEEIEKLSRAYMREPIEKLIAPGANDKPTVDKVVQGYFAVEQWDKFRLLKAILKDEKPEMVIVFCRTKHGADKIANQLRADGIECREIHGDLRQSKRDTVMKGLRNHKFEVLVATDLASRGIDVAGISHIINYDLPDDVEVYVHRIGRTARMGAEGKAYSFVTREQGDQLTKIENLINMLIPAMKLEGFEPRPSPSQRFGPVGAGVGSTPTKPATAQNQAVDGNNPSAADNSGQSGVSEPVLPVAPVKPRGLGGKFYKTRRR